MNSIINANLRVLEQNASIFWREINPRASSCIALKRLLETYATYDQWDKVVNLSSRAVLHLNKNNDRTDFYHIWICALNESKDYSSLNDLAEHLVVMGKEYSIFKFLAATAYAFTNQKNKCLKILKEFKHLSLSKNKYYQEALGLFLSSLSNLKYIKKGIYILKKLCSDKNIRYLTWRNCLSVLSMNNCESDMSRIYNLMHIKFPFAHEPYLVASLIAIDEKNWNEAIRILNQIIIDNPENSDAILALAYSYEESGKIQQAYDTIEKNKKLFHAKDFDYNYAMARIYKNLFYLNESINHFEESIKFYDNAISIAKFLNFCTKYLYTEKEELVLISGINKKENILSKLENVKKENVSTRLNILPTHNSFKDSIK
jgi:tetratricopeptide (TPR) repeat protein